MVLCIWLQDIIIEKYSHSWYLFYQSIVLTKKRNLVMLGNLLSIISSNGKDNIEKLWQIFNTYFAEKSLNDRIAMALRRNDTNKIA